MSLLSMLEYWIPSGSTPEITASRPISYMNTISSKGGRFIVNHEHYNIYFHFETYIRDLQLIFNI